MSYEEVCLHLWGPEGLVFALYGGIMVSEGGFEHCFYLNKAEIFIK